MSKSAHPTNERQTVSPKVLATDVIAILGTACHAACAAGRRAFIAVVVFFDVGCMLVNWSRLLI